MLSLGVGGAIAAIVLGLWRQDRKESTERYEKLADQSADRYAQLAKESQDRYADLAVDFRSIVQDNTKAITMLAQNMTSETNNQMTVRLLLEALRSGKLVNVEASKASKG